MRINSAKYCILHYFVNCSIVVVSDGELFAQDRLFALLRIVYNRPIDAKFSV